MIFLELFLSFFKVGLFCFGGGSAPGLAFLERDFKHFGTTPDFRDRVNHRISSGRRGRAGVCTASRKNHALRP